MNVKMPAFLVTRYADREIPEVRTGGGKETFANDPSDRRLLHGGEEGEFDEEIAALREASKTVMLTDTEQYTFFSYLHKIFGSPFPI